MKIKKTILPLFVCSCLMLQTIDSIEHQPLEKYYPENAVIAWDFHGVLAQRQLWPMIKQLWSILKSDPHPWQLIKIAPSALYAVYDIYYANKTCCTYEELIEALTTKYPAIKPHKQELLAIMINYIPIEKSVELLQKLKQAGYRNFLASNMGEFTYRAMSSQYPSIFSNFDGAVLPQSIDQQTGFKIGKPCFDYFKALRAFLETKGISTKIPIIFIDDRIKNIQAATAANLNIQALLFTNPDELEFQLYALLSKKRPS